MTTTVNEHTMSLFKKEEQKYKRFDVVQYLHEICNTYALEWTYRFSNQSLDITMYAGSGSVFTVRPLIGREDIVVSKQYWNDELFNTVDSMKEYIEDQLSRLERPDLQPGKEKSLLDAWQSLARLADVIHHSQI